LAESEEQLEYSSVNEMLDDLKNNIAKQIKSGTIKAKVGDLLKIIELQNKLSIDSSAEDKFWEMIEKLRQEELKDE
jgi:hypothetical protein